MALHKWAELWQCCGRAGRQYIHLARPRLTPSLRLHCLGTEFYILQLIKNLQGSHKSNLNILVVLSTYSGSQNPCYKNALPHPHFASLLRNIYLDVSQRRLINNSCSKCTLFLSIFLGTKCLKGRIHSI